MPEQKIEVASHPAPFNREALDVARKWLSRGSTPHKILDPFAGIGRIHELRPDFETYGIEIEPEWARASEYTLEGDMFDLKRLLREDNILPMWVDTVITSPVFGNRMSDHHDAKDDSRRITYRHTLGRPLHENNSGRLNWGKKYRDFHLHAWALLTDINPIHDFMLNIKDHIRKGERQYVTEFHVQTLRDLGWALLESEFIEAPGIRDGANHNIRVNGEMMLWFHKRAEL